MPGLSSFHETFSAADATAAAVVEGINFICTDLLNSKIQLNTFRQSVQNCDNTGSGSSERTTIIIRM